MPPRLQPVLDLLAPFEPCAEDARIGADRQGLAIVRVAARQHDEAAAALLLRERPRAPARGPAAPVRDDPDLEDAGRLVLAIILGMANARPGRHDLHVAGIGAAPVAETVLVTDRALPDIGDDLHVGM